MTNSWCCDCDGIGIRCSLGVSLYPEDSIDAETLIRQADTAMYRVKTGGRDGAGRHSDPDA